MNARLEIGDTGYFIAKSETIGAKDEEIAGFINRGPVPTDRQQAIYFNLSAACQAMIATAPAGSA